MSFGPSTNTWAKSMVPYEEICGVLIPHGEACSIQHYLSDPVTNYAPSQYYVYDYNQYARQFTYNLTEKDTVDNTIPDSEVIHPMNHPTL